MMMFSLNHICTKRWTVALSFVICHLSFSLVPCAAQIKIGGNVYGGGNAGDMTGNTSVTIHAGDLNQVYGGARVADVGGSTFVHVDGEKASDYIVINKVFGGNDISGTVGHNGEAKQLPGKLTADGTDVLTHSSENGIDETWDAAVRISTKTETTAGVTTEAADAQKIYIGQLFAAGNGDYTYASETSTDPDSPTTSVTTYTAKQGAETVVSSSTPLTAPVLAKSYLEICGGSIVYAYGGGNNATVTSKSVICVDNPSAVVNSITDASAVTEENPTGELLTNDRFKNQMGINTGFSYPSSDAFQIGRLFGGNNKADMAIIPKWNLKSGSIRNLYSGGNEGRMTSPTGILLEIMASSTIKIDNVYGGCRKSNVEPLVAGTQTLVDCVYSPEGYKFPRDLAARVLVRGGDINNVYGGNDVSGRVYFGNAVGIYTSIRGDVYGGGNGSYPYTDNPALKDDDIYADLYYNPEEVLPSDVLAGLDAKLRSAEALNAFRPNAEQVSLRVAGTADKPVVIGGGIFVGGNSATLKRKEGVSSPMVELKIGSHVLADKVFLGNNGANMVKYGEATGEANEGVLRTMKRTDLTGNSTQFNSMNLLDPDVMAKYMEGCVMDMMPSVVFDDESRGDPATYLPYASSIGSFYCGGNVGSMRVAGTTTIDFPHKIIIFDKLVGGCNNANVDATGYNAAYQGGLLGTPPALSPSVIGNKLVLNLSGLKIRPMRWKYNPVSSGATLTAGTQYYTTQYGTGVFTATGTEVADGANYFNLPELEWNVIDSRTNTATAPVAPGALSPAVTSTADDLARRLHGGNIYGGCCESGIVNGNVVINLNETLIERDVLFDRVATDELGEEESLYGDDPTQPTTFTIEERRTGVILGQQGMDVLGSALNVFGGGKGKGTEIWGSTTINLNSGYAFQLFGGSEEGIIGHPGGTSAAADGTYTGGVYAFNGKTLAQNDAYSCYINVKGKNAGVSKQADSSEDMAEAEFIYGGGFFGPIAGNTVINLGQGRVFNTFAGSCNADILGHSETYIGRQIKDKDDGDGTTVYSEAMSLYAADDSSFKPGFPWVRDITYGGNDLGGHIYGSKDFSGRVSSVASEKVYSPAVLTASAYTEYLQGRADGIFGGCYGTYDYSEPRFSTFTYSENEANIPEGKEAGDPREGSGFSKPRLDNAFVNFRPAYLNLHNMVNTVYGAGQGEPGEKERDMMQNRSYVLVDIPDNVNEQGYYQAMEVFGAGAWGGVGMNGFVAPTASPTAAELANLDLHSAVIDLVRGKIGAAYGGSYKEGVTRRTVVNVPAGSTIDIGNIFGGAYGVAIADPCDVYEGIVNYCSGDATVRGAVFGGNNSQRRTLYGKVNISAPVWSNKASGYLAKVYGAGQGKDTWSEYTEVNLESGARVYEVYGGGLAGKVYNRESCDKFKQLDMAALGDKAESSWKLGGGYDALANDLTSPLVRQAEMDDRDYRGYTDTEKAKRQYRYNANVIVNEGATVAGYAYGGGYGSDATVAGTTYFALLGGTVVQDIYGSGTSGGVEDMVGVGHYDAAENTRGFTASTNVYVKGGTVRNVYGGGWRGSVGHHDNYIDNSGASPVEIADAVSERVDPKDDILGETHVVIGDLGGTGHTDGVPSILRNVYGGGEGGSIYGTAYVRLNDGRIGYRYTADEYIAELDDTEAGDNKLDRGGNVFGGGYVANSYVDHSDVKVYGGIIRGGLYGGGEIGPIGRGTALAEKQDSKPSWAFVNDAATIYKGGSTHVELYGGHVLRDVFGGGRGYDNWGGEGYMTAEEKATMDLSSKGYVFGSTDVHIYGGEVGTAEGALQGYGNVFGGGNEGFVYSATGKKMGIDRSDEHLDNGVPADGGGFYYKDNGTISSGLSLDCNVVVEPYCKVKAGQSITIGGTTYPQGSYVPVEALNKLRNWNAAAADWGKLDITGVTIHNALFAGGNITPGSDIVSANTVTVFGNAAASLRDVYNRDLISLGTDDLGGLYGDGNLTLVDGFRELHIDNYGTDHYSLDPTMEYEAYLALTDRQKDYYQMKYGAKNTHTYIYYESKSNHAYGDTMYRKGQKITSEAYNELSSAEQANWSPGTKTYAANDQIEESEFVLMDADEQANWALLGVCSIYAGRPLNTIQRADMCGVFGSRIVLKGAQDRVPDVVDYNNYTINRVDEVSLNKRTSQAEGDTDKDAVHGNYFGIYNIVNYLGNLTSDVFFDDVRKTDVAEGANAADGKTYYQWKAADPTSKYRNNGTSTNKVALASGVYLEIKREEGEKSGTDDWGYITGVVELDLINVMQGMGGGYVYARNEHGKKTWHGPGTADPWGKVTMLDYNTDARTYRRFTYDNTPANVKEKIETSGNFVHNTKQIVDDCYPNSGMYNPEKAEYEASPAHYWFIKGYIYVYDQYISAYTGTANAYAERVELPLTIAAASNARMTLREVQPNYYAYYDKNGNKLGSLGDNETFEVNNKTYRLNDPITYWDYLLLSDADKTKFEQETYVVIGDCYLGETLYEKGTVLLPDEYTALRNSAAAVTYEENGVVKDDKDFDYFFRPSNNLSHDTGYVLTYDVNNPAVWNNYYTKTETPGQANALDTKAYGESSSKDQYTEGPTYVVKSGKAGVYGQRTYKVGEIINGNVRSLYEGMGDHLSGLTGQAEVKQAYVVTKEFTATDAQGNEHHYYPGTPIADSQVYSETNGTWSQVYDAYQWAAITDGGNVAAAKVCTQLLEFSTNDYVYAGQLMTAADVAALETKVIAKNGYVDDAAGTADAKATTFLNDYFSDAYYCTKTGLYGGTYFDEGKAYRAIDSWCSLSEADRANFAYSYDALDVLIDPTYSGRLESNYGYKPQYDGTLATKIYSEAQPIDYQAEFVGYTENGSTVSSITYGGKTVNVGDPWLDRTEYEAIPNEKHHYSPIEVIEPGTYYVVSEAFMRGDIPYTLGQMIDGTTYESMTDQQKAKISAFELTNTQNAQGGYDKKVYYYCREAYTVNEKGMGVNVTPYGWSTAIEAGSEVPKGTIISKDTYDALPNYQVGFTIHGTSPTEVSTLYVSNESDINDLSKEKIITVVYLYEYEESDESGLNVVPVSERHIVNIHINFKSGVPEIGEIKKPDIVIPGTTVGLEVPTVTEGAYRVTDSGWEIFDNQNDADTHLNGQPFTNNVTPLYWYQNGYYLAYYAQTYLGKTYSNSVPFTVANYHDLKKVMEAKEHHYYIDHKDVDREPKIYIGDYSAEDKNGLDLLKQLYDLSVLSSLTVDDRTGLINDGGTFDGHKPLDERVKAALGLEFFLQANQDLSGSSWTPIANGEGECFEGTLHGDGYYIKGLSQSLFGHLCGNVYNLGVMGSFTGAGVAETGSGYVENCWVSTSSTDAKTSKPVFGTPTGDDATRPYRIVNCYYEEDDGEANAYTNHSGTYGTPTRKPQKAFYNGEVAYDLNGFYLYKRYADRRLSAGTSYHYYTVGDDNTLSAPLTKYYAATGDEGLCSASYVERRFADGDFRYAGGTIPDAAEERLHTHDSNDPQSPPTGFYPIWPHDYIFFGQALNYGHVAGEEHEAVPSHIEKSDSRIVTTEAGNRVYRAPAYYRSSSMQVAHFNPYAVFAQTKKGDDGVIAYKDMTAIDFTGHNDATYAYEKGWNNWSQTSQKPQSEGKSALAYAFYPPLLDDDGLSSFTNVDLTRNLLAYTGSDATAAATKTTAVVSTYLQDKAYAETNAGYRSVAEFDVAANDLRGHWVLKSGDGSYAATRDHLLVDKNDFDAPISYTFDAGKRMWYQRRPESFVDRTKGWEAVSLPFTAELVTTNVKGEITHFYGGSETSKNGTGTKIGHEYWLRELTGEMAQMKDANGTDVSGVLTAGFNYPAGPTTLGVDSDDDGDGDNTTKTVGNTFLWDYYYVGSHSHKDLNADTYQTYYQNEREYPGYAYLTKATPYIIGFPGATYYEFDLSGTFVPTTTAAPSPVQLSRQFVTFASPTGYTIRVSDDEKGGVTKSYGGQTYTFRPSYLNEQIAAGSSTYTLQSEYDSNSDGEADVSSFVKVPAAGSATEVSAFRPYFTSTAASGSRLETRSIVFAQTDGDNEQPMDSHLPGYLTARAGKHKITVSSLMEEAATVRIMAPSGLCVATFTLQPGESRETYIVNAGVYIVQSTDGRYVRKLAVR